MMMMVSMLLEHSASFFTSFLVPPLLTVSLAFSGRRFVVIQMQFWYLTEAGISENCIEGMRIFQIAVGTKNREAKSLLTAVYE